MALTNFSRTVDVAWESPEPDQYVLNFGQFSAEINVCDEYARWSAWFRDIRLGGEYVDNLDEAVEAVTQALYDALA